MSLVLFLSMALNMLDMQPAPFHNGDIENGWYASPIVKIGQVANNQGVFVGAQGGWVINHRFVLGGKGYMLTNPFEMDGLQNISVGFGCGGIFTEYIISSNQLFHFSVENMMGIGGVYNDVKNYNAYSTPINYTGDACFVIEPGVNLNFNLSRNFQITAGVNYRFVGGIDYDGGVKNGVEVDYHNLSNTDLSGLSFQMEFKFGRF